jgi:hydrophobic/amphiphilic exporter-1 (mainly G- bacteria), HAE1 family
MQWLAELCVRRPVFATVLSLTLLVVGSAFYTQLGVDQFPKIEFPVIVVATALPGASPEDVEKDISDKIEAAVNTLSSLDELRSISSEGYSQVIIQFLLEKNVDVAAQEVQQKINMLLPELPRGINPPVVMKFDPDALPIIYIALRSDAGVEAITDVADRLVRRRLETVSGVGQVQILGGRERQINVEVDPIALRALGISPLEAAAAINAQNITLPGGRVDVSRDYLTVRVEGRVKSVDELRDIIIRNQNGRAVRLAEIAEVTDGVTDATSAASWNGEPTVLLAVRKQSGTNTISVVDAIRERMSELEQELPAGYSLVVQRDGSAIIRTGTAAVTEHLILGALLAAIVVLIFLGNLRSTVIAALAIPTSIIGTFALMKMMNYTLNTITLLALALAVGIVIDDAIVVLENIFRHVEEKNMEPREAAVEGTREIGLAVLATTLSLIAVFLPIAFIAGIPGRFLASFGITMSFSIAVSLWVSFTLTPMLASRWLAAKKAGEHRKTILERMVDISYRPVERWYVRVLGYVMRRRWIVVVASVLAFVSTVPLGAIAKKGFLPVDDRAQFEIVARLPEGRSLAATKLIGERVARLARELPEVEATLLTVGDDPAQTPNLARIYVKLVPPDQRQASQDALKARVRDTILPHLPSDLRVTVADVNDFGGGQPTARVQYVLSGPDLRLLEAATDRALAKLRKVPGAVDVDSSLVVGKPELGVHIDRERAADLGVQVLDVGAALQYLVAGQKVSSYSEGGEQYDVWMRSTQEYRTNEDLLQLITVPSRKLGLVSLADVVRIEPGASPSSIQRFQRERQVTFLANAAPGYGDGAIGDAMRQILEEEVASLPPGFSAKPQGQTKLMKQTALSFVFGLLAAFVFMYLILAAQFESWLHPVTILISLPLTLPFAIASVILFDQALDIYSFLGIFVLFGVVKKNAILQIDHTNGLRAKAQPRVDAALAAIRRGAKPDLEGIVSRERLAELGQQHTGEALVRAVEKEARLTAILQANRDRLRPILMTTLAFVAGMVPLVVSSGIGSGFQRATAGVVVGGQVLSLVLTLLAAPVAYSLFDDVSMWVGRLLGRRTEKPMLAAVAEEGGR